MPIASYFRVCDGVRVRFADTRADSDVTVLLLALQPSQGVWATSGCGLLPQQTAGAFVRAAAIPL
jgi:hypothetical protein